LELDPERDEVRHSLAPKSANIRELRQPGGSPASVDAEPTGAAERGQFSA
jgi:hypothetical protein